MIIAMRRDPKEKTVEELSDNPACEPNSGARISSLGRGELAGLGNASLGTM
jgi:hypothetical protein